MLLILSVLPPFAILGFIILLDKYERESFPSLLKAFLWGIAIIPPILMVEAIFDNLVSIPIIDIFIGVAFVEEIFKFLPFYFLFLKSKSITEPFDVIVYSLCVSTGFATVENILYVFSEDSFVDAVSIGLLRSITAIPLHSATAILMAYPFLKIFQDISLSKASVKAIFYAVLLHGTYDYFLIAEEASATGAMISLAVGLFLSRLVVKKSFSYSDSYWRDNNEILRPHRELIEISKSINTTFRITNNVLIFLVIFASSLINLVYVSSFNPALLFGFFVGRSVAVFAISVFLSSILRRFNKDYSYENFLFPIALLYLSLSFF